MWKEGTIGIPKKDGGYKAVHYWIKVYDEGSEFGINGGRISKLTLKMDAVSYTHLTLPTNSLV